MTESLLNQRNKEIEKIYKSIISSSSINLDLIERSDLLDLILEHPAPRFYITPKMAERYVLGYKKQLDRVIQSRKINMIEDLVSVYNREVSRRKNSSREMIWHYVVTSPAKSFYVSKKRLEEIIFNYTGRNGKH